MGTTKIEWTRGKDGTPGKTWTPLRAELRADALETAKSRGWQDIVTVLEARKPNGELRVLPGQKGPHCEKVSAECMNCYSETNAARCLPNNGLGLPFDKRAREFVNFICDENILMQPLHWKTPRKIFVCSQTDLFGEWWHLRFLDRVFAVMAMCQQHTFQCLTKRPKPMFEYITDERTPDGVAEAWAEIGRHKTNWNGTPKETLRAMLNWPLPNVWLGVSVGKRKHTYRIDLLRDTPAAVRFVSAEPLLEDLGELNLRGINVAIWGGESGTNARDCNVKWIRHGMREARRDGCRNFVKQLGGRPIVDPARQHHWDFGEEIGRKARFTATDKMHESTAPWRVHFDDRKGGDIEEWPLDLRVREMPEVSR